MLLSRVAQASLTDEQSSSKRLRQQLGEEQAAARDAKAKLAAAEAAVQRLQAGLAQEQEAAKKLQVRGRGSRRRPAQGPSYSLSLAHGPLLSHHRLPRSTCRRGELAAAHANVLVSRMRKFMF